MPFADFESADALRRFFAGRGGTTEVLVSEMIDLLEAFGTWEPKSPTMRAIEMQREREQFLATLDAITGPAMERAGYVAGIDVAQPAIAKPLLGEADPELERLLAEEEEIERRHAEGAAALPVIPEVVTPEEFDD